MVGSDKNAPNVNRDGTKCVVGRFPDMPRSDLPAPALAIPAAEHAKEAGLRYVYDSDTGISRRRAGKGFTYTQNGARLADKKVLGRVQKLAIPPAWRDVWICPSANGHLQATGFDERGRKQYLYHEAWRARRDENKFANMLAFGLALPGVRRKVNAALNLDGLPREKVIATIIRLLDRTGLRVGNDAYTAENSTFGLTTIRKKHLDLHGTEIAFNFPAKGGKQYKGSVSDAKAAKVIAACEELPGYRLFKYVDESGALHDVTSGDVNAWLHENVQANITAKDFRTWNACTLFVEEAIKHCGECGNFNLKPILTTVSQQLGNTPAILKKSYVHPALVDLYRTGCLLQQEWDHQQLSQLVAGLSKTENLLLVWLQKTYG